MMKKIIFIIPYFGKFPSYFPIWLLSCKYNPTINWLIFTDDKSTYEYPENVKVIYTDFKKIVNQFQAKYDFPIVLNNPYQLCEFKVAYGEVFSDYTISYDFWGHCDIDVVWGNLRKHLPDSVLNVYSKISWRGHLTLYKNIESINKLYRCPIDGVDFYQFAFSNPTGYPLAPDERAINYLYEIKGERIYKDLMFADLKIRSYNFFLLHFPDSEDYKNQHQIFKWEAGSLERLYTYNGKIISEDFAYIHFLKRSMAVEKEFLLTDKFLIVPNKFININKAISISDIKKLSEQKFYWSYLWERFNPKYVISKIKYWKSKKKFMKQFAFVPLRTLKLKLPKYKAPVDL